MGRVASYKSWCDEYDALLQKADDLIASIEKNYATSTLPERPDEDKILAILVALRTSLYQV